MLQKELVLKTTTTYLRNNLSTVYLPNQAIRIMVDERVPPTAGEEFIGVRGSSVETISEPSSLAKVIEYGITISITRRVIGAANEDTGANILTDTEYNRIKPSLEKRAGEIAVLLDNSWELMQLINAEIFDGCFLTPFSFLSEEAEPETVDASHFDINDDPMNPRYVGLHLPLEFGGAEFHISR
jgi:hypothetical protein